MTDREKLAVDYALVLAKYGEGSPEDKAFLGENQTDGNTALLCEAVMLVRERKAGA